MIGRLASHMDDLHPRKIHGRHHFYCVRRTNNREIVDFLESLVAEKSATRKEVI
jgi:hypothetical protein